jgi:hypothetical protein
MAALLMTSVPASLSDVSWLSGRWKGEGFGGVFEEEYNEPRGGVILGTSRITGEGDKLIHKEFIEIRVEGNTLVYTVTLPTKTDTFRLGSVSKSKITWVHETNPFPRQITYELKIDRIDILLEGVSGSGAARTARLWMKKVPS